MKWYRVYCFLKDLKDKNDLRVALALGVLFVFLGIQIATAQHLRIFACAIANDSVGASLGASSEGSGLYQSDDTGKTWKHLGWNNIKCYSMDMVQSSNGRIIYEATGLGILRSTDAGEHWKQITDWRVSEAMDVAVNQKNPNEIYIATAHGPWRTRDGGKSWELLMNGLPVPYTSRIVIDSVVENHILVASEAGIFQLIYDSMWKPILAEQRTRQDSLEKKATRIRAIIEVNASFWVAGCENTRLLISDDSAKSFYAWMTGPDTIWCVSVNGKSKFNSVFYIGGPRGEDYMKNQGDVYYAPGPHGEYHDVSAWIAIPRNRDFPGTFGTVSAILATLGDGMFVQGRNTLPHRQIWTLKSFLVSP